MALKVAVIGMSPSCADAPYGNPEWECWGMPWHDGYWRRMARLFEMHDMADLQKNFGAAIDAHIARLLECSPLYMAEPSLPNATAYPMADVVADVGDYFSSSIAYMLALAIHERAEEIALFGVDMKADEEYGHQKPNCEYLIGLARGRGIKVTIHDSSPLCKYLNPPGWTYAGRYGKTQ